MNSYKIVTLNNEQYGIIKIKHKNDYKFFVIDAINIDKVLNYEDPINGKNKKWHYVNNYIYATYMEDGIKRQLYLHNYLLDRLDFNGKGQQSTVDHINRIGLDNRMSNLRVVKTQTEQNLNRNKPSRSNKTNANQFLIKENINLKEIPKNVSLNSRTMEDGTECLRFELEIKNFMGHKRFRIQTSKSNNISLTCKFEEIKQYINELADIVGDKIFKELNIDYSITDEVKKTIEEYNKILTLSNYENVSKHLIDVNNLKNNYLIPNYSNLTEQEIKYLENIKGKINKKYKLENNLLVKNDNYVSQPKNVLNINDSFNYDKIPQYCRFTKKDKTRGIGFIFECRIDNSRMSKNFRKLYGKEDDDNLTLKKNYIKMIDIYNEKINEDKQFRDKININHFEECIEYAKKLKDEIN